MCWAKQLPAVATRISGVMENDDVTGSTSPRTDLRRVFDSPGKPEIGMPNLRPIGSMPVRFA